MIRCDTIQFRCRGKLLASFLALLILQQRTSGRFLTSLRSLGCSPLQARHQSAYTSTAMILWGCRHLPCASMYPLDVASSAPAAFDTTAWKCSEEVIWVNK